MAVNLIRKNNQLNVTAYDDTVLFHLIKGANGVLSGVGDLFTLTYNASTQKMKINSGMGMVYGRQFQIKEGEEVEMDWSALTGVKYISVYVEVDLRDPTNETATFKSTYASSAYPAISAGDNLITTTTGVARMLMFWVYRSATGQISITNEYYTLRNDWIANADFATNATNTTNATNSTMVGNNTITNSAGLRVTRNGQLMQEIIESKKTLFSGSQVLYNTVSKGVTISLSDSVGVGDIVEVIYACTSSDTKVERVRVLSDLPGLSGAGACFNLAALTSGHGSASGFTATSDTFTVSGTTLTYKGGFCLHNFANGGGSVLLNNRIILYQIYKIIGGAN